MANSVDLDQTAPMEQSDLALHCLLGDFCFQVHVLFITMVITCVLPQNSSSFQNSCKRHDQTLLVIYIKSC